MEIANIHVLGKSEIDLFLILFFNIYVDVMMERTVYMREWEMAGVYVNKCSSSWIFRTVVEPGILIRGLTKYDQHIILIDYQ